MSSPKRNVAYEFDIAVVDTADTGAFKSNPTIAAGDFKVSTDNSAFANLTTLPVVSPAGSIAIKINLSAAEMNGDKIMIQALDVAGNEWDDVLVFIDATTANVDDIVRSTTPANTLDVNGTGEVGLDLDNTSGTIVAAQIATDAITSTKIAADAITSTKIAADAIGASELATDAVNEIRNSILSDGVAFAGATIAAIKAETVLIVADTSELQVDDVPGLIAALNNISTAQVNTEVDTALVDINLDHLMAVTAVTGDVVNNSIIARLTSKSVTPAFSDYVNTTDSLQAQRDNIGSAVGVDISADIADLPTGPEFNARTLVAASYFDPAADAVANVTLVANVTTLTGHTVQTGDSFARIGAGGSSLGDLGGMSTAMKAETNAELVDVMSVDTIALPGKIAPPLTPTRDEMSSFLYKFLRNRSSLDKTALLHKVFADDETTVDHQATISDDGTTFIREEMVVGV